MRLPVLWAQAKTERHRGRGQTSRTSLQNIDKSLEFYRDILGLEVAVNQPFAPNPAIARLGNTLGGQSRYVALKVPGSGQVGINRKYKDIEA